MTQSSVRMARMTLGSYDEIAHEYYDPERHPTCANLGEASLVLAHRWLSHLSSDVHRGPLCEVGAGKSLLGELLRDSVALRGSILIDRSAEMLRFSLPYVASGCHLVVGDAKELPIRDSSCRGMMSSLGDPYNEVSFWMEAARVISQRGCLIFTTPSHRWASTFRDLQGHDPWQAEFETSDGRTVLTPSTVLAEEDQIRLAGECGFDCEDVQTFPLSRLRPGRAVSGKLLVAQEQDLGIVTGYRFRRR